MRQTIKGTTIAILLGGVFFLSSCKCSNDNKATTVQTEDGVKRYVSEDVIIIDDTTLVGGQKPVAIKDLGTINAGEVINFSVNIKSMIDLPLILYKVSASCGCTTIEHKKEPMMAGEVRTFNGEYNSKGKEGNQRVSIRLHTDRGVYVIRLTVFVKKDKTETKETNPNSFL